MLFKDVITMGKLNKIEFKYNGEYKDVDYYVRKYSISKEKISAFKAYFKKKKFFNGDKIGIERLEYDGAKLTVVYFKTNYEVAILVRKFLSSDDEIKLEESDERANMGFNVLLKDVKGRMIITRRSKDWHGNDVSNIDHFQLTTSEGIEINDVESEDEPLIIERLIARSLREELGLDIDLTEITSLRIGYKESENTYLTVDITVEDIYELKYNIHQSEDKLNKIMDIKDALIIPMKDLKSNSEYTPALNDYLDNNINWL